MGRRLTSALILSLCLVIFGGCSKGAGSQEKNQPQKSNSTDVVVQEKDQTEKSNSTEASSNTSASTESTSTTKSKDGPLECDWTLHVDQTIPIKTDGMTVNYSLVLVAQKKGGIDVLGDYKGSAYIEISMDASNLSNEVIKVAGGFNVNASTNNLDFQLIPYDIESYSDYGLGKGEIPLAPLVKYETMALISPEMQGNGVLNPSVKGVQGEKAEVNESMSQTMPIPMKITVIGGQVRVEIPSFKIGKSFEGMLLGTPVNSGESNKRYDEMMKKIDELEAQMQKK
jgi:hypothetical protein